MRLALTAGNAIDPFSMTLEFVQNTDLVSAMIGKMEWQQI
jgi:hypothetical protein